MKNGFQHILWFIVAGGVGFVVDAGVLQGLTLYTDMSPVTARIPSFLLAVAVTWFINSRLTFGDSRDGSTRQLRNYLVAMILGGLVNWLAYLLFLELIDISADWPVLALVPAVACSMTFNYLAMRFHIFRKDDRAS